MWLRRRRALRDLDRDIDAHLAEEADELVARGVSPNQARRLARVRFGSRSVAREDTRSVWIWRWLDTLQRELRQSVRSLRREPILALTAILTFGIGVGVTATTFSIADAELWRPLPFDRPSELVAIRTRMSDQPTRSEAASGADVRAWQKAMPAVSDLAGQSRSSTRVVRDDRTHWIFATDVTSNYLSLFGRRPTGGRVHDAGDGYGRMAIVLTERGWRRAFDADPSIVGRPVTLDGAPATIVGIVATDDSLGPDPDAYIAMDETAPAFGDRNAQAFYGAIGRLAPGATAEVARQQLDVFLRTVGGPSGLDAGPRQDQPAGPDSAIAVVEDLRTFYTGSNWRPLYFFLSAACLVLVLCVVNITVLLVSRAWRRTREFALRGALGGGAGALARQLLVEGALIAVPGAVLGVLLTAWAIDGVTALVPEDVLMRGRDIPVDGRTLAAALAAATVTTLFFALMPLPGTRRMQLTASIGSGSRTHADALSGRLRGLLLTTQLALTIALLAGAGIFVKSYAGLVGAPLGFDADRTFTLRASLAGERYTSADSWRSYAERWREATMAVPGVEAVGIGSTSPLGSGPLVYYDASLQPGPSALPPARAIMRAVDPGFFDTLGITIRQGRNFNGGDVAGAPRVAIVNEVLAHEHFGSDEAVGKHLRFRPDQRTPWTRLSEPLLIVGVVANVKEVGINEVPFKDVYVPFAQTSSPWFDLVVRARSATVQDDLVEDLRAASAAIDTAVQPARIVALDQRVDEVLRSDYFNLAVISAFAAVALLLAAIGIYGTVSQSVHARTGEFGIRIALGARPSSLVANVLTQAARVAVAGSATGLLIIIGAAYLIGDALYLVPGSHNGLLYGVSTTDPVMIATAIVLGVAAVLAAGALPARRVTRLDPDTALREE